MALSKTIDALSLRYSEALYYYTVIPRWRFSKRWRANREWKLWLAAMRYAIMEGK